MSEILLNTNALQGMGEINMFNDWDSSVISGATFNSHPCQNCHTNMYKEKIIPWVLELRTKTQNVTQNPKKHSEYPKMHVYIFFRNQLVNPQGYGVRVTFTRGSHLACKMENHWKLKLIFFGI